MKNRYIFFKRLFPEAIVALDNGKKLKSFGIDKRLLKYINNENINSVIINNENKVCTKFYEINNYRSYVIKVFLEDIINKVYFK